MWNRAVTLALLTALAFSLSIPALAGASAQINDIVVAAPLSDAEREATMKAVRAFYDFWNHGDEALLKQAIADNFTDRTMPKGRPQGPDGPAFASRQFRAAVPDLQVVVQKLVIAGEYVTVHMRFTGHFTGRSGQTQGKGQEIAFTATDLVKVENGRITDNWHIEDNLTLLLQTGIAKVNF